MGNGDLKHWSYYVMELVVLSIAAFIGCLMAFIFYFSNIAPTHPKPTASHIQSQRASQ